MKWQSITGNKTSAIISLKINFLKRIFLNPNILPAKINNAKGMIKAKIPKLFLLTS